MQEIIAAVIGGFAGSILSFWFAFRLRNDDRWQLFQEEIGVIRAKFLQIEKSTGLDGISKAHRDHMSALSDAVYRVRPYIDGAKRAKLLRLLEDYRTADQRQGTGFWPADLAGNYKGRPADSFSDPQKAVVYLSDALDGMIKL